MIERSGAVTWPIGIIGTIAIAFPHVARLIVSSKPSAINPALLHAAFLPRRRHIHDLPAAAREHSNRNLPVTEVPYLTPCCPASGAGQQPWASPFGLRGGVMKSEAVIIADCRPDD